MEFQPDVIIIGAGAAGLAAASRLTRAGVNVQIIEARERIGGRIYTVTEENQPTLIAAKKKEKQAEGSRSDKDTSYKDGARKEEPAFDDVAIELGAEFVHGKSRELWDLIGGSTERVDEVSGTDWCVRDRQVGPCDFFQQVNEFLDRMKEKEPDRSFAEWARNHRDGVPDEIVRRAFGYVEGFNAAHAEQISVNSLVRSGEAEEKIEGQRAFRIQGGYNFVPRTLLAMCDPQHLRISMNTVVERIEWGAAQVNVSARRRAGGPANFRSSKSVVTLPLGVMKADAVEFSPSLESKRAALDKIAVGHVIRVVLRFRERFWESIAPHPSKTSLDGSPATDRSESSPTDHGGGASKTLADMRFLFTDDEWFPTFWSTMPRRAPVLVAWAPATAAEKLTGRGEQFQIQRAIRSLSEHLGVGREYLEQLLERGFVHDWQADPFARGAYSYVCVGGGMAEQQLAENLAQTLFFAGEATDTNGYFGTVHGAIASGYRAAEEILSADQH